MANDDLGNAQEARIAKIVASLSAVVTLKSDCMVWIGSGLSVGSGYPSWNHAVEKLCQACIPAKSDIPPSPSPPQLLYLAGECKAASPDKYIETLGNLFGRQTTSIRAAYVDICACPFRFLLTTNYDPCLEKAGQYHAVHVYPDLRFVNFKTRYNILYLHGKARWKSGVDASNLLLTAAELDNAYSNTLVRSVLEQLLTSNHTIFVGCGLNEPVLQNLFHRIRMLGTTIPDKYQKFILFPDGADAAEEDSQAKTMGELGITILRYPLGAGNDPHRFLDEIWERVRNASEHIPHPFSQTGDITE